MGGQIPQGTVGGDQAGFFLATGAVADKLHEVSSLL
jgi:hypothetical protein